MMTLAYCKKCLIPNTRPFVTFDAEGVCSACRSYTQEQHVDWTARSQQWEQVVAQAKERQHAYDCLLPVSGGKDSTWQTQVCLDYGLHCLALTWKPAIRTELGTMNLENLKRLGVDHLDFTINPQVEKKMHRKSFVELGADSSMHLGVFSTVMRYAYQLDIPLVVWSENSATTYAGIGSPHQGSELTVQWVKDLGSTHGRLAEDYRSAEISAQDLVAYACPTQEQMESRGIRQVFLGYYFDWDPVRDWQYAKQRGFQAARHRSDIITGWYPFADLDDPFVAAHHALKMWKFGQNRSMDNLSLEIRAGRKTREDAIEILRQWPDDTNYGALQSFCDFIEISLGEFYTIAEKFRNLDIWRRDGQTWKIQNWVVPGEFNWNGVGQPRS